jgi:hypothetical protein
MFCDRLQIPTGSMVAFIVQIMASIAELERGLILE